VELSRGSGNPLQSQERLREPGLDQNPLPRHSQTCSRGDLWSDPWGLVSDQLVLWSPHLPAFLGAGAVLFWRHSTFRLVRPRPLPADVGASSPHQACECCECLRGSPISLIPNEAPLGITNAGMK